jgi:Flp pilus assembly protein TadD
LIQESGFAIGNKKQLIFLVEEGIHKFPELQGDLEIIPFSRDSIENTFIKLNQMIESMRGKKAEGTPSEKRVEVSEPQEAITKGEKVKKEIESKEQEAFEHFFSAAYTERNARRVKEVYDEELCRILSAEERVLWKAIALRLAHELGDGEAFNELLKHAEENKTPEVIRQLATRYEEMREYQKAKDNYLIAKDLYDISKQEDKKEILSCFEQAGLCLALDGKYDTAIEIIEQPLHLTRLEEYKGETLSALAKIAKMSNDTEKFFVYAEGALNSNPANTDLRFDLAYHYAEKNHNRLSVLHYRKLVDTTKSPAGLNNLGVGYETLGLKAKSVEFYSKAIEDNETLAMANVAQRYLGEGFIKDAEREIKRANDLSKDGIAVHGNVGYAKRRLDELLENETNKEKEMLIEAEKEREFRVEYSEAFYCKDTVLKEKLDGIWHTRWGDVELILDQKSSSFNVDTRIKQQGLLAVLIKPAIESEQYIRIKLEGVISKMSGRCSIEIEEITEFRSISPSTRKTYEATGYMVINKDYLKIDVMEKGGEEKLNIGQWRKKID